MLDYTAIDFETANSYRGSPCSVGLIRVRDDVPVEQRHWLIRPPEGADWFDAWNIDIHGITPEQVADAPRWKDVLPHIMDFIGSDVVVAHNAGFDIGVIRYACAVDNIEWPAMRFTCTMVMARRAQALPSYRLPFVLESLGFDLESHHDALADARGVVKVVTGLAASIGVGIGHMGSGTYKGSVVASGGASLVRSDLDPDADPDGYLFGRVVVCTGTLMSMTRQIAWDECSRVGAFAEMNTTKRTNVLVVGDINPAALRPGSNLTGKTRKAFELQDKGHEIEVMTEDDFLRCLDGKPLEGVDTLLAGDAPAGKEPSLATSARSRLRSVPLADRPDPDLPREPRVTKPPRPLRRTPIPTDQICSVDGCSNVAAFKTRTKPTWCVTHIEGIQRDGGLRPLESFTHPDDYQLTECLTCSVHAHYRFEYTLDQNRIGVPTCRACYWRRWAAESRRLMSYDEQSPVSYDDAKAFIEEHGFDYLGPLTAPSYRDDPHHMRCRRCGKVSAARLGDFGSGCTCQPRS